MSVYSVNRHMCSLNCICICIRKTQRKQRGLLTNISMSRTENDKHSSWLLNRSDEAVCGLQGMHTFQCREMVEVGVQGHKHRSSPVSVGLLVTRVCDSCFLFLQNKNHVGFPSSLLSVIYFCKAWIWRTSMKCFLFRKALFTLLISPIFNPIGYFILMQTNVMHCVNFSSAILRSLTESTSSGATV